MEGQALLRRSDERHCPTSITEGSLGPGLKLGMWRGDAAEIQRKVMPFRATQSWSDSKMRSCSEYILKMELTGFPVGCQRGIKGDSKEIKPQLEVKVNIRVEPQIRRRTEYSLQLDRTSEGNEAKDVCLPPKRDRVEVRMSTCRKIHGDGRAETF